jgi:hypothetical protein
LVISFSPFCLFDGSSKADCVSDGNGGTARSIWNGF